MPALIIYVITVAILGIYILILRGDRESLQSSKEWDKKYYQDLLSQEERKQAQKYKKLYDEQSGILQAERLRLEDEEKDLKAQYEKMCAEQSNILQAERLRLQYERKKSKEQYDKLCAETEDLKSRYELMHREFDQYIKDKCQAYPHLAAIQADLMTAHYARSAFYLRNKKSPALVEAQRIDELKKETKKICEEKKLIEYKLAYIEECFPNINDIFDDGFNEESDFELETSENTDRVKFYLSAEEYRSLSTTRKNQLALDRYLLGRKSKWQIGRDYEMYIGYLYENQGFNVQYTGIIENFEDMGRDLIVTRQGKTYIIQCKNWSKEKTIHEKHIFQLFGTVTLYNIDHATAPACGVFVTTTELSSKAKLIADYLGIKVSHINLGDFPRIKCNINRTTGEKIYHLPFDQQYDRVVVEKNHGESYEFTVKDAESKGFRRAFKHFA